MEIKKIETNKDANDEKSTEKINRFRRISPQAIAATIANLNQFTMGFAVTLEAILIPALTGHTNAHNHNEVISMTVAQASWLSAIGYLLLPFGSFMSGLVSDSLGRKRTMIIVNIPFAIGWLTLHKATQIWHIFVAIVIFALSGGLVVCTNALYIGEICEPPSRGILVACFSITYTIACSIVFVLNMLMPWRAVALIGLAIPIVSTILLCFIPDTPQWLLSMNRASDAKKSLCWLRGWVSNKTVSQEFDKLQRQSKRSKSCVSCKKKDLQCSHPPPTRSEIFSELRRKSTLKPFAILIPLFFLAQFTSVIKFESFIVQIFKAYDSPIAPDRAVTIMSFGDNLAHVILICSLHFIGKRRLYLTVALGVFLSSFVIACYGFVYLPNGYTSFNQQNRSFHLENPNLAYIPMICLFLWSIFSNCGIITTAWMLLSELFSFKARVMASGVVVSINYIFGFISRKTYFDLESSLSLPGVTLLFSVVCGVGVVLMYFILPETEGRTLEDIELHFADDSKRLTDRFIPISTPANQVTPNENDKNCEKIFTIAKKEEIYTENRNRIEVT